MQSLLAILMTKSERFARSESGLLVIVITLVPASFALSMVGIRRFEYPELDKIIKQSRLVS